MALLQEQFSIDADSKDKIIPIEIFISARSIVSIGTQKSFWNRICKSAIYTFFYWKLEKFYILKHALSTS